MKCYEVTRCSEKDRAACYVWTSFRDHPEDMEGCACWLLRGEYHEEGSRQAQKCRKCGYYCAVNRDAGMAVENMADVAVISCSGTINLEKTRGLEKAWEAVKKSNKNKVLLDITKVSSIYSCGLSMIVKMHRECAAVGGMLIVVGCPEFLRPVFHAARLARHLLFAPDRDAALQRISAAAASRKEEEERKAAAAAEAPPPKKYVPCWEYWKGQNPHNATTCDECFHRQKAPDRPCWVVEGLVEGVVFQFVNETCVDCRYFDEFAVVPQK